MNFTEHQISAFQIVFERSVFSSTLGWPRATAVSAQAGPALPAECNPQFPMTGDTVVCVVAAPAVIDPIVTNVDDLTIVIGDAATPTTVSGVLANSTGLAETIAVQGVSGDVIGGTYSTKITTAGADIDVLDMSKVVGNADDGLNLSTGPGVGSITVRGVGTILGNGGTGILADAGTGNISIQGSGLVGGAGLLALGIRPDQYQIACGESTFFIVSASALVNTSSAIAPISI